jgi:D-alanyl-D-alanine carboxypeptidase/D-alanyl-D-alanine-endopeptidase (penicillin-binding protein 4)
LAAGIEWTPAPGLVAPLATLPPRLVLAEVTSQPFDSIASEVNARSSNLGAELLLRWAAGGDAETAAARLNDHVRSVTGDPLGVMLVDGSGLSEHDRASAWTFVAYLARFPYLAGGRDFPSLLPANGEGTLRSLATGLPAPGVVRAKTGTLGNVASVTGYLGRRDGVLVISMLYNGNRPTAAREEQWRLFRLLGANGVLVPTGADAVGSQLGDDPLTTPLRPLPPQ